MKDNWLVIAVIAVVAYFLFKKYVAAPAATAATPVTTLGTIPKIVVNQPTYGLVGSVVNPVKTPVLSANSTTYPKFTAAQPYSPAPTLSSQQSQLKLAGTFSSYSGGGNVSSPYLYSSTPPVQRLAMTRLQMLA